MAPPAATTAAAPAAERCPLCGAAFDAAGQGCRPSCPMSKGCHVVCCPACGYSFPQESAGLAGRLQQFFQKRRDGGRVP